MHITLNNKTTTRGSNYKRLLDSEALASANDDKTERVLHQDCQLKMLPSVKVCQCVRSHKQRLQPINTTSKSAPLPKTAALQAQRYMRGRLQTQEPKQTAPNATYVGRSCPQKDFAPHERNQVQTPKDTKTASLQCHLDQLVAHVRVRRHDAKTTGTS